MIYDHEAQKLLNQKHLVSPKPGDYWHEMFCPIIRVLDVSQHGFVILQKVGGYGGKTITASDPAPCIMSIAEFSKYLSYGSIPGTWADVNPERFPAEAVA